MLCGWLPSRQCDAPGRAAVFAAATRCCLVSAFACTGAGTPPRRAARAGEADALALVEAMGLRFGPSTREPAFETLRPKLARAAFVPSLDLGRPRRLASPGRQLPGGRLRGLPVRERVPLRRCGPRLPSRRRPASTAGSSAWTGSRAAAYEWTVREELAVGALRSRDAGGRTRRPAAGRGGGRRAAGARRHRVCVPARDGQARTAAEHRAARPRARRPRCHEPAPRPSTRPREAAPDGTPLRGLPGQVPGPDPRPGGGHGRERRHLVDARRRASPVDAAAAHPAAGAWCRSKATRCGGSRSACA